MFIYVYGIFYVCYLSLRTFSNCKLCPLSSKLENKLSLSIYLQNGEGNAILKKCLIGIAALRFLDQGGRTLFFLFFKPWSLTN